eukprot:gene5280-6573_t
MPFEVIRPPGYNYDVIIKQQQQPSKDIDSQLNVLNIQSYYGFYKGTINEQKQKHGNGVHIFSQAIYSGNWERDKRIGDGLQIVSDGFSNRDMYHPPLFGHNIINPLVNSSSSTPTSSTPPISSPIKQHQHNATVPAIPLGPLINNNGTATAVTNRITTDHQIIEESFNTVDNIVSLVQNDKEYLRKQDYYQGRWLNGRANGIGSFHFAKDNSTHQDFWRSGVVVRFINQNVFQSLGTFGDPSDPRSIQNLISYPDQNLVSMLNDWNSIVTNDDDYPWRPYLSSTMNTTNSISTTAATTLPDIYQLVQQQQQQQQQQQRINNLPQHQQPQQQQQQQQTRPSYGIITANYLKSRLDTEEKFFLSLSNFVQKWEIPKNSGDRTCNYMIVIPDTEKASFIPLSNLIMQSTSLEKLIQKILMDPNNRLPNTPTSIITTTLFSGELSPNSSTIEATTTTTTNNNTITPTPAFSKDELELFKLMPICMDLDNDENLQKNMKSILNILKMLPQRTNPDFKVPPFILQHICEIITVFKKNKPLESHLLNKQFTLLQDFLLSPPPPLPTIPPLSSPRGQDSATNPSSNSTPSNESSKDVKDKQNYQVPTIKGNNNYFTNTKVPKPSKSSDSHLSKTSTSKISPPLLNQPSTTTVPKKEISQTTTGSSRPRANNHQNTVESINQYNQAMTTSPKLTSARHHHHHSVIPTLSTDSGSTTTTTVEFPEINPQTINILLQLFKSSFEFPKSLKESIDIIQRINGSISNVINILSARLSSIKETKSKQSDYENINKNLRNSDSKTIEYYISYLVSKDQQINQFIEDQEKENTVIKSAKEFCFELFHFLYSQQINLTLKRLRTASNFINNLKQSPKVSKDMLIKFVKHIHKISHHLELSCQDPFIQSLPINIDKDRQSIKQYIDSNSELYALLSPPILGIPSPIIMSPEKPPLPPPPPSSTISAINSFVSMVWSSYTSSPSTSTSSTKKTTPPPTPTPIPPSLASPSYLSLNISQTFEPSDISPSPFSFISPLNKIPEEIQSGNYQLIYPIASSGDEILITILTNCIIELRNTVFSVKPPTNNETKLKQLAPSVHKTLFDILLHSTQLCQIESYCSEVFKTIANTVKNYPEKEKDTLFNRFKDFFKSYLLEKCIKVLDYDPQQQQLQKPFGKQIPIADDILYQHHSFLSFLANLYPGLSVRVKKEFVNTMPIQLFIDLMEKSGKGPSQQAQLFKSQSAQVLINLSLSSFDHLIEIKSKGGLATILELCKRGQVFAHNRVEESELKIEEFLGAGALAKVHRGFWNGKEVAIKIFTEGSFSFRLEDFLKEVAIMALINHPNLLKLEGACILPRNSSESTFMIVTELMHKGTLWDVIKKNHPLSFPAIIKYALSVAYGLSYLHSLDLIHRDIKASNILVDKDDNTKVGDFGLSRIVSNFNMTAVAGTPKWESPECLAGDSSYTSAADVYSYGMLLYELVTGEEPYPEIQSIVDLVRTVYEKKLKPKIPSSTPHFLSSLIKDCLSYTPKKRPTMVQIISRLQETSVDEIKLK